MCGNAPKENSCIGKDKTDATKKADLNTAGTPIGGNDMLIAATVIANDGILVTHNVGEFSRIEGLVIEDWTKD